MNESLREATESFCERALIISIFLGAHGAGSQCLRASVLLHEPQAKPLLRCSFVFPGLPCPDQLYIFAPAGTSAQESPFALLQLKLAVSFKVTFPERSSVRKNPQHLFNLMAAVMSTPVQKTDHSQVLLSLISHTTEKSPRAETVPA